MTFRRIRSLPALVAILALLFAAIGSGLASKIVSQTPLDAKTLPQFVDDVPDFSALGSRSVW